MEQRLKEIIVEVIAETGSWLIEMETMPDHVHKLVKAIKGRSSGLLRGEFRWLSSRVPSLWTKSYLVAAVGGARLSVINRCVETQKDR